MIRYGMTIDVDRCNGCGACMVACASENNVPPAAKGATERTGITWIRVFKLDKAFVPMLCQQCGNETPCVSVCPQKAVEVDPQTGIVGQMPERCLGCRYCMAACPYHARYFNWSDPSWPPGLEKTLNPDVAPRMRGVVEKCNFCHGRWHAAKEAGTTDYTPACAEACPTQAIKFGDLAKLARPAGSVRLLESLGTDTKIYYHSTRVDLGNAQSAPAKEARHA